MNPTMYVFKIELSEPGTIVCFERFTAVCESFEDALKFAKKKVAAVKDTTVDITRIERMSVVDN